MAKKIIFVHGLGGGSKTWGMFPKLLEEDQEIDFDAVTYEYTAPAWWKFWGISPSLPNVADGLLADIEHRCDLANDELVLIGHSLGGLVVKKLLLRMHERKLAHRISKVCFFDVPHDGSGYANFAKHFGVRRRQLTTLCRDSSELEDLNTQWVNSGLDSVVQVLSLVAANDDVVSAASSKSHFRSHEVIVINETNHETIAKPGSRDSLAYLALKKFLIRATTVKKYQSSFSRSFGEWTRVERDHGFPFIADEQRQRDRASLQEAISLPGALVRITGASGIGKSRLVIDVIEESEAVQDSDILVFDSWGYDKEIRELIRQAVADQAEGLIVVDNCSGQLHERLMRELSNSENLLRIITIGYSHESIDGAIHIQLSPLEDKAIQRLLKGILLDLDDDELSRVARFAQGYPLMATLMAHQYRDEGRLLGSIDDGSIVRRLIESGGGCSNEERRVLVACCLFDVFGAPNGNAKESARYIAEFVAESDLRTLSEVIDRFEPRQMIQRGGSYARVVPKPLALTLAIEWWDGSHGRQSEVVQSLPESLLESFCIQAAYLDSLESVKAFSERLFGGADPLVSAEAVLTPKGSRLFRAFVEVNRESTAQALFTVFSNLESERILEIEGDTRRNLVVGLEMLCFHASVFDRAAWSLLVLASAENEQWSNNATGTLSQLFNVRLSGTQSDFAQRLAFLRKAAGVARPEIDRALVSAMSSAISTHGSSRVAGAEYQGTQAKLEEWAPETWDEVYQYWSEVVDLLISMLARESAESERIIQLLGTSIRGFVIFDRLEMVASMLDQVIDLKGRYWPSALESINHSLEFEGDNFEAKKDQEVRSWLVKLSPDDAPLREKILNIVVSPPSQYKQNEEGDFEDIAATQAYELGIVVAERPEQLLEFTELLIESRQEQGIPFGNGFALAAGDVWPVVQDLLEKASLAKNPDAAFLMGICKGLYEKAPEAFEDLLSCLLEDDRLSFLYPDLMRMGVIQPTHLDQLIALVKTGKLPIRALSVLCYGSVISHLETSTIDGFVREVADLNDPERQAVSQAVDIAFMYCFKRQDHFEALKNTLQQLLVRMDLRKGKAGHDRTQDVYRWHSLSVKILKEDGEHFAGLLVCQILEAAKRGFDFGALWSYIKPTMLQLGTLYGERVWPLVSDAVKNSEPSERYWLEQLLNRDDSANHRMKSFFDLMKVDQVIQWCSDNEAKEPKFVANCITVVDESEAGFRFSRLAEELLIRFGHRRDVSGALSSNLATRSWTGSLVPILENERASFVQLSQHPNDAVRVWVNEYIHYLDRRIAQEKERDEEDELRFF